MLTFWTKPEDRKDQVASATKKNQRVVKEKSAPRKVRASKKNATKIKEEDDEFERAKQEWIKESKAIFDYQMVVETVPYGMRKHIIDPL